MQNRFFFRGCTSYPNTHLIERAHRGCRTTLFFTSCKRGALGHGYFVLALKCSGVFTGLCSSGQTLLHIRLVLKPLTVSKKGQDRVRSSTLFTMIPTRLIVLLCVQTHDRSLYKHKHHTSV